MIKIMLPAVIGVAGWFIVVAGWFIVNRLEKNRDVDNKRLEKERDEYNKMLDIKLKYLVDSYMFFALNASKPPINISAMTEDDKKRLRDMKKAIADIQLFGSLKQIKLCRNIVVDLTNSSKDAQINVLRIRPICYQIYV